MLLTERLERAERLEPPGVASLASMRMHHPDVEADHEAAVAAARAALGAPALRPPGRRARP